MTTPTRNISYIRFTISSKTLYPGWINGKYSPNAPGGESFGGIIPAGNYTEAQILSALKGQLNMISRNMKYTPLANVQVSMINGCISISVPPNFVKDMKMSDDCLSDQCDFQQLGWNRNDMVRFPSTAPRQFISGLPPSKLSPAARPAPAPAPRPSPRPAPRPAPAPAPRPAPRPSPRPAPRPAPKPAPALSPAVIRGGYIKKKSRKTRKLRSRKN